MIVNTKFGEIVISDDLLMREREREIARRIAKVETAELFTGATSTGLTPEMLSARLVHGDGIFSEVDNVQAVWGRDDRVLWQAGEGLMIDGGQGVGKTTLAQQLILHRIGVRRGDFLGLPVTNDGRPVVCLAMDRPLQFMRSMKRMVSPIMSPTLKERLRIWKGPLPIDILGGTTNFADFVQELEPDVGTVLVDSVKDLASGISKDEVGAGINIAWQELIARGVELLLLHHERKAQNGAERKHTLDDVYGSTWLTSGLGSVVALEGDAGDITIGLRHLKQPAMPVDLTVRHNHEIGVSIVRTGVETEEELLRNAGPDGVTAEDVAREIYGQVEEKDKRKAKNRLNKLVDLKVAYKIPGGHTSKGASPDRWALNPQAAWANSHRQSQQPPTAATVGGVVV